MKYKAIIFDVDGTLIHNHKDALPTPKVKEAINNISKKIHVGIATSRCYPVAKDIVDHLSLSGPSIFLGGAQIIDITSNKNLIRQKLALKDVLLLKKLLKNFDAPVLVCDGKKHYDLFFEDFPDKILMVFIQGLEKNLADKVIKTISHIPTISIFTTRSWTKGKTDVLVSHLKATKQHAILEVAKRLNIQTHQIIGVGDGHNDFPLLMACGLRIAMGNAVDDLKAIADYIAPPVEKDGIVDIIEKFIPKS